MRGLVLAGVVSACGGSSPGSVDAPVPGSDSLQPWDAVTADARVPDVLIQARITIALDGQPREGARILINRRDGSLVGEGMTDVTGAFDATMPEGGSLTWVHVDQGLTRFYTYTDLHEGDVVNTGSPAPPPPVGTETPVSITRASIPGAQMTKFGVARFPDQVFDGDTFVYPTTATGTVAVIQDGLEPFQDGALTLTRSVGYSVATVTVAPGAAVTMPPTIHQAEDLVIDMVAPVLPGAVISASVQPFQGAGPLAVRDDAADASGAVSIRFPRLVYSEAVYESPLTVYFETSGMAYYEHHRMNYTLASSVTHLSLGVADRARCPRDVTFSATGVTIEQPPSRGDFARYGFAGRWMIVAPIATTSIARIVVPSDLTLAFPGNEPPRLVGSVDSGDVDYREALALQRSTHYPTDFQFPYPYTGEGHPYMRECWRSQ